MMTAVTVPSSSEMYWTSDSAIALPPIAEDRRTRLLVPVRGSIVPGQSVSKRSWRRAFKGKGGACRSPLGVISCSQCAVVARRTNRQGWNRLGSELCHMKMDSALHSQDQGGDMNTH